MKIEETKELLLNDITVNSHKYPFISKFWDIDLIEIANNSQDNMFVQFGHFETKYYKSIPFYKPISKIIDLSEFI